VLSSQRRHSRRKPIRTQRLSKSVALAIAAIHAREEGCRMQWTFLSQWLGFDRL
jgi:hypothetical protein